MSLDADDLRLIGSSAPVFIKMLRKREERILNKIYGEFKNGKLEHVAALAEFCSIRDQITELTNALRGRDKE